MTNYLIKLMITFASIAERWVTIVTLLKKQKMSKEAEAQVDRVTQFMSHKSAALSVGKALQIAENYPLTSDDKVTYVANILHDIMIARGPNATKILMGLMSSDLNARVTTKLGQSPTAAKASLARQISLMANRIRSKEETEFLMTMFMIAAAMLRDRLEAVTIPDERRMSADDYISALYDDSGAIPYLDVETAIKSAQSSRFLYGTDNSSENTSVYDIVGILKQKIQQVLAEGLFDGQIGRKVLDDDMESVFANGLIVPENPEEMGMATKLINEASSITLFKIKKS